MVVIEKFIKEQNIEYYIKQYNTSSNLMKEAKIILERENVDPVLWRDKYE